MKKISLVVLFALIGLFGSGKIIFKNLFDQRIYVNGVETSVRELYDKASGHGLKIAKNDNIAKGKNNKNEVNNVQLRFSPSLQYDKEKNELDIFCFVYNKRPAEAVIVEIPYITSLVDQIIYFDSEIFESVRQWKKTRYYENLENDSMYILSAKMLPEKAKSLKDRERSLEARLTGTLKMKGRVGDFKLGKFYIPCSFVKAEIDKVERVEIYDHEKGRTIIDVVPARPIFSIPAGGR